ncbi:MAG: hypothetical protein QOI20_3190 [Acidimicrobiaceae bacterium]|nr:hypothetical protein [Acidimicrobiaceae bacterium]
MSATRRAGAGTEAQAGGRPADDFLGTHEGRDVMGDTPIKVGGQALADGVLMRTPRAWAIARVDGTVEVGALAPTPMGRIPVLRVVASLFGALRLAVVRGMLGRGRGADQGRDGTGTIRSGRSRTDSRRLNRRMLVVLVGLEAAAYVFGRAFGDLPTGGVTGLAMTVLPWAATLAVLRVATPQSLWRFHGAEHKAVSAHEAGVDLHDTAAVLRCARVHNRCGTNLVFLMLAAGYATRGHVGGWWQVPMLLAMIGVCAEVVTVASTRPQSWLSRVLLGGGKALQRWVTTAEPTPAEQAVGSLALLACLDEHARIVSAEAVSAGAAEADAVETAGAVPAMAAA